MVVSFHLVRDIIPTKYPLHISHKLISTLMSEMSIQYPTTQPDSYRLLQTDNQSIIYSIANRCKLLICIEQTCPKHQLIPY